MNSFFPKPKLRSYEQGISPRNYSINSTYITLHLKDTAVCVPGTTDGIMVISAGMPALRCYEVSYAAATCCIPRGKQI